MGIDDRMDLCSSWHNIGSNAIISADEKVVDYLTPRTQASYEIVKSDTDAEYDEILEYDVSTLETQVAFPSTAMNVGSISAIEGMAIDQACIGSCANGRMEDLRIAAKILKGRKIHHNVRMYITPVSQEVMKQAISEGLISIFIDAGIMIPIPSCSTCPGHVGQLADGEICVATHTANYAGRMGSLKAKIYLSSAAAVAASAVDGKMTNPQKYL
jgi:3-isopropylmalate/(R)-2-methylmalate dehydratase large subunit